jgi:hypothetical protein
MNKVFKIGDKVVANSDGYTRHFEDRGKRGFEVGVSKKIWSKGQEGEVISVRGDCVRVEFVYPNSEVYYYQLHPSQLTVKEM